jgi:hypothetical protein
MAKLEKSESTQELVSVLKDFYNIIKNPYLIAAGDDESLARLSTLRCKIEVLTLR